MAFLPLAFLGPVAIMGIVAAQFDRSDPSQTMDYVNAMVSVAPYISLLGLAYFITLLGGAVAVGVWTFRIVKNAYVLEPGRGYGPWGAVLWWLVPGANLVFPLGALRRAWRASNRNSKNLGVPWLLVAWWVAFWSWIVLWLVDRFASPWTDSVNYDALIQYLTALLGGQLMVCTVGLASAFLFVNVVRRLTRMQVEHWTLATFEDQDVSLAR